MIESNEIRVVEFHDGLRDENLTPAQIAAYAEFDKCKLCTRFGAPSASSARQVAQEILDSGIDTDMCTQGIKNVSCPYGETHVSVIEALIAIKVSGS